MAAFSYTYPDLTTDTYALVAKLMQNLNDVKTYFNGAELLHAPFSSSNHGDLSAAVTQMHSAASSLVTDTADYFTGSTVETVLAELGLAVRPKVGNVTPKFVGYSFHASTPGSATVTIPANSASSAIIVVLSAKIAVAGGGGINGSALPLNLKKGAAADADLSLVGTRDGRFELVHVLSSDVGSQTTIERTMFINASTVSGFSVAEANIVKGGTLFTVAGTAATVADISITAYAV